MTHCYHVFGLNIKSEIHLVDLPEQDGASDVTITYGEVPRGIDNVQSQGVRFQAGPDEFLLKVDNIASYYVSQGQKIIVQRNPYAADHEVSLFLMGPAMGALLHQRNILPLHGSAIDIGGAGVIFLGPSSIGKSTLAAGFQKRGYTLLADDLCAVSANLTDSIRIIPGFPELKLWPDTLKKLNVKKTDLLRARIDENFNKFYLPLSPSPKNHLPIKALFLLKTTNADTFNITELTGKDKLKPLLSNTYRPRFVKGLGKSRNHFEHCARVVSASRMFGVTRPRKGFFLDELLDLVEGTF